MKKHTIMLLCCIIVLITGITALCNGTVQTLIVEESTGTTEFEEELDFEFGFDFEPAIPEEMMTEYYFELEEFDAEAFSIDNVESTFIDICDIITENDIASSDELQIKNAFISTAVNYNMNSAELNHVKSLFAEGYDIEKVLDIYEFLRWTNCDYTAIAGIYDQGIKNSDNKNWIYDAYDEFFDRKDDMLSVEDVAYYVNNGITVDEIAGAYELSFAGAKTTKQMLSERLSGNSWNTITATSLSAAPESVINAPDMTMDEIMAFRNISVRQRKDFTEIVDIQDERVTLKDEAISAEREKALEKSKLMADNNITPVLNPKTNADTTTYANNTPQTFNIEEITEDDLIPFDEPEVE